jgi:hypothetical protein
MEQSPSVGATIPQRVFNLRGFCGTLGFITTFSIPNQINPLHGLPFLKIRFKTGSNKVPHYGILSSRAIKKHTHKIDVLKGK